MIRDITNPATATPIARPQAATPPSMPPAPARQEPPAISPALRLDAQLNMLVIEFRDDAGKVLHSLPSPQQLDAYRSGAEEPPATFDVTG